MYEYELKKSAVLRFNLFVAHCARLLLLYLYIYKYIVNKVLCILSLRFLLSIIPFTMMPLWAYHLRVWYMCTCYRLPGVYTLFNTLISSLSYDSPR